MLSSPHWNGGRPQDAAHAFERHAMRVLSSERLKEALMRTMTGFTTTLAAMEDIRIAWQP